MTLRHKSVKIMSQLRGTLDWREELKHMLINAGTIGLKQSRITKRFDHWIEADELTNELEFMAAEHKVQKFITSGRGRPAIIWRATTEILK